MVDHVVRLLEVQEQDVRLLPAVPPRVAHLPQRRHVLLRTLAGHEPDLRVLDDAVAVLPVGQPPGDDGVEHLVQVCGHGDAAVVVVLVHVNVAGLEVLEEERRHVVRKRIRHPARGHHVRQRLRNHPGDAGAVPLHLAHRRVREAHCLGRDVDARPGGVHDWRHWRWVGAGRGHAVSPPPLLIVTHGAPRGARLLITPRRRHGPPRREDGPVHFIGKDGRIDAGRARVLCGHGHVGTHARVVDTRWWSWPHLPAPLSVQPRGLVQVQTASTRPLGQGVGRHQALQVTLHDVLRLAAQPFKALSLGPRTTADHLSRRHPRTLERGAHTRHGLSLVGRPGGSMERFAP